MSKQTTYGQGGCLSCRRATELAAKELDAPLTAKERWTLRIHLLICVWCRRYRQQIGILRKAARLRDGQPSGPALGAEARERIAAALKSTKP